MEPLRAEDPVRLGRYRVHARLGSGGMGQVYLGFSPAGRAVALKVIHAGRARDEAFRERFWREVAAARQVGGAHTAAVLDAGVDAGRPWLASVFVHGPSLHEVVSEHGPLPAAAAWRLAGGLGEALSAVHACGLVHRDLKPANVMLAADGPRVIDFGLTRVLEGRALTESGLVCGTPGFMSPEQAQGTPAGPASDVFSLGCVLAFATTGTEPFGRGSSAAVLYRIVHAQPNLAGMSARLGDLTAWCLAKREGSRPSLSHLLQVVTAQLAAGADSSPASFWPDGLTELIRSYVARLDPGALAGMLGAEPAQSVPPPAAQQARSAAGGSLDPVAEGRAEPARAAHAQRRGPVLSRRHVLAGLAGAVAAGTVATVWGRGLARSAGRDRRIWSFQTGGNVGTPAVAGQAVYLGSANNAVYALRASDGAVLWKYPTSGPDTAGPTVAAGVVYVASYDGNVYALTASDGSKVWSYAAGGSVYSVPTWAGGFVYTGSGRAGGRHGSVTALGSLAGAVIWKRAVGGTVFYAPSVAGGVVYTGSSNGSVYALRASDGAVLWTRVIGGPLIGPRVAAGVVYTGSSNGHVYALRAHDGAMLWTRHIGGHVIGTTVAGSTVFLGNTDGSVYALRAGDGTMLWAHQTGGTVIYPPAVAGGVVYLGNHDGRVSAMRASDGRPIWTHTVGGPILSTPAVAHGVAYVGCSDGRIYALRAY